MELDKEEVLNELMNFEKNYGRDCESGLPDCLERFLINIAKSGDTIYPWNKIKPVILKKIELVVNEFNTKYPYENNPVLPNVKSFNFQEMKDEIIEKFDYFYGAPFTIQRICELLTDPSKYYKRSDKFMRGLEKNVRVISTVEARRADIENEPKCFQRDFYRSSSPLPSSSSSNILSSSPSSSSSSTSSSPLSSAFMNGLNDKNEPTSPGLSISSRLSQSCSPLQDQGPLPNSPAPLQQLDSFTTVFASPPSTPLAVVSDIHPYDGGSPSSSSSSSSESSPQPSSSSSPPPSLAHDENELNQSVDTDFEDNKDKDDDSNGSKSEDSNEPTKLAEDKTNVVEQGEPMDQTDGAQEKSEKDSIKLDTPSYKFTPFKPFSSMDSPNDVTPKSPRFQPFSSMDSPIDATTNEGKEKSEKDSIKLDTRATFLHHLNHLAVWIPLMMLTNEGKEAIVEQCSVKESNSKEENTSEITESTSSLSESSSEKNQEDIKESPSIIDDQTLDESIESKASQQIVEPVETCQSSVVASTDSSQSSGQKEETDGGDDIKCGGDSLKENNDSIKIESINSLNTSVEENLTQDKEDQESNQEQPTSSGSSTVSEEETADNSVTTSNQQSNIDEKPESH
ncbi:LOW QUALITY PROTEIN: serine/threonine-protein phosphatase 4 regulatory subunit 2-B-like [Panonychus citri]|uniref:LOW QUALITY PROTEIN: serine/threonine-protein phosphatase 4 regulatory subunit 2-B-like n=1 Tax=Panonychus citri TaxID=50023 RepID=UPI0023077EB1|nr:LOW QUALITY PROTEIN: serine/threonine-protein phosphatase 4 regulatory subunit 2-B-like [Panonychus citri]